MKSQHRPSLRPTWSRGLSRGRFSASRSSRHARRGRLLFESLETRALLAADLFSPLAPSELVVAGDVGASSPSSLLDPEDFPQVSDQGEGEDAPDLVAFAKALAEAGVKFYGAGWCPFCTDQKELFDDGKQFLPFIEVTNPDRTLNAVGVANNIEVFPTWEMPDGDRFTGVLTLEQISTESGVAIPQGSAPSFAPLPNVTVLGGAPLHVALNGYDPNGTAITYTVTSSNPNLVTPELRTGRSLELETSFGKIVIGTFEDLAPGVTTALFELVNDNEWDGTVFHRVINGFMIQGGDPTGTGFGDSSLPKFDDEFHVDGQHTSANIASTAKAGDDSASSQFFLTEGPQRHLDFNHTVWGLIVEGAENREAISNVAVNSSDRPTIDVNVIEATVFEDPENAVLTLKAPEGATGSAMITVTATDSEGLTFTQSFQVTVTPDTANGTPFLNPIQAIVTSPGSPVTISLTAQDAEGNTIQFQAFDAPNLTVSLPGSPVTPVGQTATATMTITPDAGFVGTQPLTLFVHSPSTPVNPDTVTANQIASFADVQTIVITVVEPAPTGLDLLAASDSGISDTDNVTNDNTPQITVTGVTSGAVVRIYDGDTPVAQGTASGTTITLTTSQLSDGAHVLASSQELNGSESARSAALNVTIDTALANISGTPATLTDLGVGFTYDPGNPEEGQPAFTYDLLTAPDGATINSATGVINWTPVASQIGDQNFQLRATDRAGNTREQLFTVEVEGEVFVDISFELVDDQGNAISQVTVGDQFTLNVFVEDSRRVPAGVFAAYMDVIFESGLVDVVGPLQFSSSFTVARSGNTATEGLIDEAGAASGSLTPPGGGKFLLFSVDLEANIAGTERILADPADDPVTHDILVFGMDDPVSTALVSYGSVQLTIGQGVGVGANGDIFNFDEDSTNNFLDVLDNDESTGTLTITARTQPSTGGSVEINATNDGLIYTPPANFNGSETFTYTVMDSATSSSSTATVVVQVQPVNDDPTAVADTATVNRNSTANLIFVLTNDLIAPDVGETLRVVSVGSTSNGGTARVGAGGNSVEYDAPTDFSGTDTFNYTISDGNGGSSTATVTVTVAAGNAAPVANNDTFEVDEDSTNNILDVLDNDNSGAETGETLTILSVQGITNGGTVEIINGGTQIRYTPAANYSGFESFTYRISDGNGGTDEALVTVTVNNLNDPPTAVNDALVANKDQAGQTLDVLANDTDPDGTATLIISSVTPGSNGGTLTIAQNQKTLLYTPATDFDGTETFTYTVADGSGATSQATVTVTVRDFVPSSLSGFVYLDVNNDGIKDAAEMLLVGVTITLAGTDSDGNTVSLTRQTGNDGSYLFADLAPGTYTLTETQPVLLLDGIDTAGSQGGTTTVNNQIAITLAEGTTGTNNNFGERGRSAQHISLLDLLASSHDDNLLSAVSSTGTSTWYAVDENWSDAELTQITTQTTTAPQALVLTASDGNGGQTQANVSTADTRLVSLAGQNSQNTLFRFLADPSAFTFVSVAPPISGSGSSGSGEGEVAGEGEGNSPIVASRLASPSASQGEGESSSLIAASIFGDPAMVPAPTSQPDASSGASPTTSVPALPAAGLAEPDQVWSADEAGLRPDVSDEESDAVVDPLAVDAIFAELGRSEAV